MSINKKINTLERYYFREFLQAIEKRMPIHIVTEYMKQQAFYSTLYKISLIKDIPEPYRTPQEKVYLSEAYKENYLK